MPGCSIETGRWVPFALATSMTMLVASPARAQSAAPAPAPSSGLGEVFGGAPKGIAAWAGIGLTSQDSGPALGTGSFAMAEYVVRLSPWFSPRIYGGFLFTSPDGESCDGSRPCNASASIGFVGLKGRFTIPIPYVSPFIEGGFGATAGTLTTVTASSNVIFSGVTYHLPVALGLSFGDRHRPYVDLAFTYLFHPEASEFAGAVAISYTFWL